MRGPSAGAAKPNNDQIAELLLVKVQRWHPALVPKVEMA
jgi:hypothetical protein